MSIRPFTFAAAVAAAALLTPVLTAPPVLAKDDPAAEAKAREAVKKDLKDKKFFYSYDLSYSVDSAKLKESRWSWKDPPPFTDVSEKQGGQFYAVLASDAGEQWVTLVLVKHPHFEQKGSSRAPFQVEFKSWAKTVLVSKIDEMAEGQYEDWIREATDVIKDKCKATKKKSLGPGEYYATAVGTDKKDKKRVRKTWVTWGTTGGGVPCTWIAEATIAEKFVDTEEIIKKVDDMIGGLKEIKDPRLK
jgi:hypothetical protein